MTLGGIHDVGINMEKLLTDEFYIWLRQRKAIQEKYAKYLNEFTSVVKHNYAKKGTTFVVLITIIPTLKSVDGILDALFFFGVEKVETGITLLTAFEMSKQVNASLKETRRKF